MQAPSRVLVCDDEPLLRLCTVEHLKSAGYDTLEACDGAEAIRMVAERAPCAVLLDIKMPKVDGLSALKRIRESGSTVPVIMMTSRTGVDDAINATRLGAGAYFQKPFSFGDLTIALDRMLKEDQARSEVHLLRDRDQSGFGPFVGRSDALQPLFADLGRMRSVVAPTVLVLGESGTGKDVVARTIHQCGPRRDQVYVEVDCASLSDQLIESELFGYERGAFTDAKAMKRGLLEVAGNGVVFLDEIGEISLGTQAKLLRALENRTFKRVGGLATLKLDAQVIAATNRDLKAEVEKGRFREDLYYRLNVVTLKIPSLRDRRDDVPLLASYFLEKYNKAFGRQIEGISGDAMALLQSYHWPGNVRELKNLLERIVILGPPGMIRAEDLPASVRFARLPTLPRPDSGFRFELPDSGIDFDRVEREFVTQAIGRTQGNQTAAAKLLGMSRYQLRYRLDKFGLERSKESN
jgi:two-component system response regulator AtoC